MEYFTGKPCKRGHVTTRHFPSSDCKLCRSEGRRERYYADPAAAREASLGWYYSNLDRARAHRRAYGARTTEQVKARSAAWYAANKDRARATWRARYERDKAKIIERAALWNKNNKEARRCGVRNRRARIKASVGHHTASQVLRLLETQKSRCVNCRVSLKKGYHVDHIHPVSKGGSNDIRNVQLLCQHCNVTKHAKDPITWARENGRLL